MANKRILVVDDEQAQRELVAGFLTKRGYDVTMAASGEEAIESYHTLFAPVALVDMKMTGMNGIELTGKLREINPFVQVLVLTAFGSVETAVEAMKGGACDYLTKPIEDLEELLLKIEKAAEQNDLIVDRAAMQKSLAEVFPSTELIGESDAMNKVREMIARVAPQDATVLITGESGTGKEVVARAIHAHSPRSEKRLVAINCAALPENLLESELFGYEKGAFTGAQQAKQGRFELADGGTLFLDEIGEMPLSMQVKLLRVLDDNKVQRLGSIKEIPLDIRIITATNRDLKLMVEEKSFREDLYYRLNVISIELPPLHLRGGDILILAQIFIDKHVRKSGKKITGLTPEAAQILTSYSWPGNVRELENLIERAIVLTRSERLVKDDLAGLDNRSKADASMGEMMPLAEVEKKHISMMLDRMNWNLSGTAEKLGIHRNTLRSKIKEYKLSE